MPPDADFRSQELRRGVELERRRLPELGSVKIQRPRGVALRRGDRGEVLVLQGLCAPQPRRHKTLIITCKGGLSRKPRAQLPHIAGCFCQMEVAEEKRDSGESGHRVIGSSGIHSLGRAVGSGLIRNLNPVPPGRGHRAIRLIQIEIPDRRPGGLVLGFLEGFFELAVEQLRFDLLVVGALAENRFAAFGFLLEKLGCVVQVWPLILLGLAPDGTAPCRVRRPPSAWRRSTGRPLRVFSLHVGVATW